MKVKLVWFVYRLDSRYEKNREVRVDFRIIDLSIWKFKNGIYLRKNVEVVYLGGENKDFGFGYLKF